jgi:phosphate/sulfate permease
MGEELYNAYPQFACINNTQVGIRHVASKFNSTEECYFRYGKEVKWNLVLKLMCGWVLSPLMAFTLSYISLSFMENVFEQTVYLPK